MYYCQQKIKLDGDVNKNFSELLIKIGLSLLQDDEKKEKEEEKMETEEGEKEKQDKEKSEKEKEPEANFQMLDNPARVMKAQVKRKL